MQVEQGSKAVIWAHFLKQDGEEATITGTPTITIRHYNETTSSIVTDVDTDNMTQVSGSLYNYVWAYTDIVKTQYAATFAATYDTGENVTGSQEFTISSHKIIGAVVGSWSPEEKDRVVELVEKIVKILQNRSDLQSIKSEIDTVQTDIGVILDGVKNITDSTELVNHVNKIREEIATLKTNLDLQLKLISKTVDPQALEEVINEQESTDVS